MLPKDFDKLTAKQYMGLVADQGCYICKQPAEIHHNTKNRAYSKKSSDFDIIPLCPNHHRGKTGIHGHIGIKEWESIYGDQDKIVQKVRKIAKEELKNYI